MENKAPILISYLSLIILVILLLQVSGVLKAITVIVTLIAASLIVGSLAKESKWDYQAWYAFLVLIVVLLFLLAHLLPGSTGVTEGLSVGIIITLIVGFFLSVFTNDSVHHVEENVQVVEFTPEVEVVHTENVTAAEVQPEEKPKPKARKKQDPVAGVEGKDKYHTLNCLALKNVPKDNIIVYKTKRKAQNEGRTNCRICLR